MFLILAMALVLLIVILIYAFCDCCKTSVKTKNKLLTEAKRLALLMQNQNDSFYNANEFKGSRSAMPPYIAPDAFISPDGPA